MSSNLSLERVQKCVYRRSSIVTACGKNDFGIEIQFPWRPTLNGRPIRLISQPLSPTNTQNVSVDLPLESKINQTAEQKISNLNSL